MMLHHSLTSNTPSSIKLSRLAVGLSALFNPLKVKTQCNQLNNSLWTHLKLEVQNVPTPHSFELASFGTQHCSPAETSADPFNYCYATVLLLSSRNLQESFSPLETKDCWWVWFVFGNDIINFFLVLLGCFSWNFLS